MQQYLYLDSVDELQSGFNTASGKAMHATGKRRSNQEEATREKKEAVFQYRKR